jgi:hypothetical protein
MAVDAGHILSGYQCIDDGLLSARTVALYRWSHCRKSTPAGRGPRMRGGRAAWSDLAAAALLPHGHAGDPQLPLRRNCTELMRPLGTGERCATSRCIPRAISAVWPTSMPAMSVMALSGPRIPLSGTLNQEIAEKVFQELTLAGRGPAPHCYHRRKSLPVISLGCFSPRNPNKVGDISCSAPPCRNTRCVSSTRMKGTGLVVW